MVCAFDVETGLSTTTDTVGSGFTDQMDQLIYPVSVG